MTRLAELYEDREDGAILLDYFQEQRGKAHSDPELRLRADMAIEDIRSRIREIDDEIFDIERGLDGTKG